MTDQIFLESSLRSLLIALLAVGLGFYISKTLNKNSRAQRYLKSQITNHKSQMIEGVHANINRYNHRWRMLRISWPPII